jgi:TonB family protein
LNKFGFLAIFITVVLVHLAVIKTNIPKANVAKKSETKITKIRLSSIKVAKPIPPKPKVEPIVLPQDPKPIKEVKHLVEPIILPPEPDPKPIKEVKHLVKPIITPLDTKPIIKPKKIKKRKKRLKNKKQKVVKTVEPTPINEPIPQPQEIFQEEVIEAPAPKVVEVDRSAIKDRYTSLIRRLIRENLYYPKAAIRMRMYGTIRVGFVVQKDGSITNVRVLSGGKSLLKKGAIRTIKSISPPPIPSELGVNQLELSIPIEFNKKPSYKE